jgi:hypothetical protein
MARHPHSAHPAAHSTADPNRIRGDANWTIEQWRTHVDSANNLADKAWETYILDLTSAYSVAYKNVKTTLDAIEAAEKAEMANTQLFFSVILPTVGGGFLSLLASSKLKEALQKRADNFTAIKEPIIKESAKFVQDKGKSALEDWEKEKLWDNYRTAASQDPFTPPQVEPFEFYQACKGEMAHAFNQITTDLVDAMKGPPQDYKKLLIALYNSPFIWVAPKESDLAKWKKELHKPLEVFLWAAWANQLKTKYWLERIMRSADDKFAPDPDDINQIDKLTGVLKRLLDCGVPMDLITMPHLAYRERIGDRAQMQPAGRVFNVLWVRHLASHYQNTFLGLLLDQIDPRFVGPKKESGAFLNLNFRPGSVNLM